MQPDMGVRAHQVDAQGLGQQRTSGSRMKCCTWGLQEHFKCCAVHDPFSCLWAQNSPPSWKAVLLEVEEFYSCNSIFRVWKVLQHLVLSSVHSFVFKVFSLCCGVLLLSWQLAFSGQESTRLNIYCKRVAVLAVENWLLLHSQQIGVDVTIISSFILFL